MTARLRAPGIPRAFLFLALGTLLCAAIIIGVRGAYGYPTFDGGLTVKAQNGILLLSLLIAPLFFLVGLGAFDYWFYWAAGKPTRPGTTRVMARPRGATTSASTPTTR